MNHQINRIIIIGATSLIAQSCARVWIKQNLKELILIGRNIEQLEIIKNDLQVRNPTTQISCFTLDFFDTEMISLTINSIFNNGYVDIALIAHGFLADQQRCQADLKIALNVLNINAISPVLFAESIVKRMEENNHGKLVMISSVAGDRIRKSNYIYGVSKKLVISYTQGLQHRLAKSNVKVIVVKPGPTDTPMTSQLKESGAFLASPDLVANIIVKGIKKNKLIIYAPKKWKFIMLIIKIIPTWIFNKLSF